MNILMMTNSYTPLVGGVPRSIATFATGIRERGHRVLVVAPEDDEAPHGEIDVVRVPAIQRVGGSPFSVRLPVPTLLHRRLDELTPDIVHSHHPFLLGDSALRVAASRDIPIVFTHHTRYELLAHHVVEVETAALRRFAENLATEYANLCDHVVAPSESLRRLILSRGVERPVTVIPTGIPGEFARGDGVAARREYDLPDGAFVIGHAGRLDHEKNLVFLARVIAGFLERDRDAYGLIVGRGGAEMEIRSILDERGVRERVRLPGTLDRGPLAGAYRAMDAFVFASKSDTQGLVLAEALAAGVPLVALDAPGARDIVEDGVNGRLLGTESEREFVAALAEIRDRSPAEQARLRAAAEETAAPYAAERCIDRMVDLYAALAPAGRSRSSHDLWSRFTRRFEEEVRLWLGRVQAAGDALLQVDEGE